MVVIIDYGVGNLTSIFNMIRKVGGEAIISDQPQEIATAEKLILPGVGAFDHGMIQLKKAEYYGVLQEKVLVNRVPMLGVCLGVQLFCKGSEEGSEAGLGWIDAEVRQFKGADFEGRRLKIPHMGWAEVRPKKQSPLLEEMYAEPRFYFVHSFHLSCNNVEDVLLEAEYGYNFTAAIECGNIIGVQFHPEKSHKYGQKLYENFLRKY